MISPTTAYGWRRTLRFGGNIESTSSRRWIRESYFVKERPMTTQSILGGSLAVLMLSGSLSAQLLGVQQEIYGMD